MADHPDSISIIVPCFNEAKNLPHLIERLGGLKWPCTVEWVFVDDCSTDDTAALLKRFQLKYPHLRSFTLPKNQGKSAALAFGIEKATGGIIAIQDGDLEYDPRDLLKLAQPIREGTADVVYGSRFRRESFQVHRTFHMMGNRFLTLLSNLCSGIYLTDMETCYKVFRADLLKSFRLRTRRFGFEPEVTAYLAKLRLRILEMPVAYHPRSYQEGKKIGWKDGVAALWFIFKFNFLISAKDCLKPDHRSNVEALEYRPGKVA